MASSATARKSTPSRPVKKARIASVPGPTVAAPTNLRRLIGRGGKVEAKSKTQAFKDTRNSAVDESTAILKTGSRMAEAFSSDSDDNDSDEEQQDSEDSDDDVEMGGAAEPAQPESTSDAQPDAKTDGTHEAAPEPTFADMLASANSAVVLIDGADKKDLTVQTAITNGLESSLQSSTIDNSSSSASNLSAPHLTTLLTTALQTNDLALLRTCLSPRTSPASLSTIRLTIERLPSALVISLLGHIADVMHRRPGRAGSLMVWVQWSLVCHGGYISSLVSSSSKPGVWRNSDGPSKDEAYKLIGKLRALDQVCAERTRNLERLLQLKGKLDILVAQTKIRRERIEGKRRQHDADSRKRVWIEDKDGDQEVMVGPDGVVSADKVVDVEASLRTDATPRITSRKSGRAVIDKATPRLEKTGVAFDTDSDEGEDGDVVPVSFMNDDKDEDEEDEGSTDEDDESVDYPRDLLDIEAESGTDEDEDEDSDEDEDEMEGEDLAGLSSDDEEGSSEDDE